MILRLLLLPIFIATSVYCGGPPQAPSLNPDGKLIEKDLFIKHEAKIRARYNAYIPQHQPKDDLMRIVTWNVHMLKAIDGSDSTNWEEVMDDVQALNPDVLVMQEIPIDGGVVREFEGMLRELGYDNQFKAFSKDSNAKLGVMVASRYPITASEMVELGHLRVLVDVQIILGTEAEHLRVLGTHLEVSSSEIRQSQTKQIRDYIQTKGYKHFLLMGDFNAKWDSPEIQVLRKARGDLFKDTFDVLDWDLPNYTCWSGARIDYMFTGPQARRLNGTYVYHGCTSDHLPLIADLLIDDEHNDGAMGSRDMLYLALFILFFMLLLYMVAAVFAPPSTWNRAYQYVEGYDEDY